jgi:hypothetical protein
MSEFKGQVVFITLTTQVNEKFKKRDITLKSQDEYPQYVTFQLIQDKCSLADNLKIGEMVELKYNLKGRMWEAQDGTTKYFNTLEAWTMSLSSSAPVENKLKTKQAPKNEESDDLPF